MDAAISISHSESHQRKWWMFQILSTTDSHLRKAINPPTGVGGWFRFFLQQTHTYESYESHPTGVGGNGSEFFSTATHTYESYESHQRELVDGFRFFYNRLTPTKSYKSHQRELGGWFKILFYNKLTPTKAINPTNGVGGWFSDSFYNKLTPTKAINPTNGKSLVEWFRFFLQHKLTRTKLECALLLMNNGRHVCMEEESTSIY